VVEYHGLGGVDWRRCLPVRPQLNGGTLGGQRIVTKNARFPGYEKCLALMRKHDPQLMEDGFGLLLPHASAHIDALMRDFREETDHGLRCWLLELIGHAQAEVALGLLVEQLASSDDSLRDWAIRGLQRLDSHQSRKALFDAGVSPHSEVTRRGRAT
jgi:hypothetical protein